MQSLKEIVHPAVVICLTQCRGLLSLALAVENKQEGGEWFTGSGHYSVLNISQKSFQIKQTRPRYSAQF